MWYADGCHMNYLPATANSFSSFAPKAWIFSCANAVALITFSPVLFSWWSSKSPHWWNVIANVADDRCVAGNGGQILVCCATQYLCCAFLVFPFTSVRQEWKKLLQPGCFWSLIAPKEKQSLLQRKPMIDVSSSALFVQELVRRARREASLFMSITSA